MTITAAMTSEPKGDQKQVAVADVSNLWSVMNIYACNYWFLGVEPATEITESFRDQDGSNQGETFTVDVKVCCVPIHL